MPKNALKSVMDPDENALKGLPKTVRFQLMVVLALLWSAIFCISAGVVQWLPGYMLVHVVLLLIGVFGTGWIFRSARSPSSVMAPKTVDSVSVRTGQSEPQP
ncbi:MAG: hypothetical protein ACKVOI_00870 [Dongiaceae bacterium]